MTRPSRAEAVEAALRLALASKHIAGTETEIAIRAALALPPDAPASGATEPMAMRDLAVDLAKYAQHTSTCITKNRYSGGCRCELTQLLESKGLDAARRGVEQSALVRPFLNPAPPDVVQVPRKLAVRMRAELARAWRSEDMALELDALLAKEPR